MATVVLDPGHGGTEKVGGSSPNNATGPCGLQEKTVTLAVALAARDALQGEGVTVLLTRDRDVNLGLAARATVAKRAQAAAFVSIHFNGWTDPTVQGTEVYHDTHATPASRTLAKMLLDRLVVANGLLRRGVKQQAFGVILSSRHDANTAAVLTEISFLTDPSEENRLRDPVYITRLGGAIALGVMDSLRARKLVTRAKKGRKTRAVELEDGFSLGAPLMHVAKRNTRRRK